MSATRRKDVEGQPDNGGQFAGKARPAADDVALDKTASPWPTVEGHDVTQDQTATIGGSWAACPCNNTSNREGFVLTDEVGNFRDWSDEYEGLICLVCGRFYRDGTNAYGAREVKPTARFDVQSPAFETAYDEYWHRNSGITPSTLTEPGDPGEPGTPDPNYAWSVSPVENTKRATVDYDGYTECNCGNSSTSDGFVSTDDRGALQDDYSAATGLICRVCGNFYRIDPAGEGTHQVPPTARFALADPKFKAAEDEQWNRLNDPDGEQADLPPLY